MYLVIEKLVRLVCNNVELVLASLKCVHTLNDKFRVAERLWKQICHEIGQATGHGNKTLALGLRHGDSCGVVVHWDSVHHLDLAVQLFDLEGRAPF